MPTELLFPNDWNPNEETADTFNLLVKSIEDTDGVIEPLQVAPKGKWDHNDVVDEVAKGSGEKYRLYTGNAHFEVVNGEHRYRSAGLLKFHDLPCVIHENWDKDKRMAMSVKMNVLRGTTSPEKLFKMVQGLRERYQDDVIQSMLGFSKKEAFTRLIGKLSQQLPSSIAKKLKSTKDELQTIDELSETLNRLFKEYGKTLDKSFMVFTYGGRIHYMVRMNDDLTSAMRTLTEQVENEELNLADVLAGKLHS